MRNYSVPFITFLIIFSIGFSHSCHKEDVATKGIIVDPNHPLNTRVTEPYTEEFENVADLVRIGGWYAPDSIGDAPWGQGINGQDPKGDTSKAWYGFPEWSGSPSSPRLVQPAYGTTKSDVQFAYSFMVSAFSNTSTCGWLITPILSVKNGDKISFFIRGDSESDFNDRMQVLMNKSTSINVGARSDINSVGDFNIVLDDINAAQTAGGYPTSWTKKEYTFSGITGNMDIRIGFKHFASNPVKVRGVGIDLFKFEVN
jgi:hypothetical protein